MNQTIVFSTHVLVQYKPNNEGMPLTACVFIAYNIKDDIKKKYYNFSYTNLLFMNFPLENNTFSTKERITSPTTTTVAVNQDS